MSSKKSAETTRTPNHIRTEAKMNAAGVEPSGHQSVVTTHADLVVSPSHGRDQPSAEPVKIGANVSTLSKASEAPSQGSEAALSSVFQLFRYATWLDVLCLFVGAICAGESPEPCKLFPLRSRAGPPHSSRGF